MRPLYLEMAGFGSYGETAKIAFDNLHSELFLVTGDTGAGKTTIFDAISFALFGDTSSSSSEGTSTELHSHYAGDRKTEPYVKFIFTAPQDGRERTFEVRRTPRWYRRTRLDTLRLEDPTVKVWRHGPGGEELLTDKVKPAKALLRDLIGLTKEEFARISMLAQGEFMAFLKADAGDKQEMFRKLFGTEKFAAIAAALRDRAARSRAGAEKAWNAVLIPAGRIRVPEEAPGREEIRRLTDAVRESRDPSPKQAEDLAAVLASLCSWQETQAAGAEKVYRQAEKAWQEAHDSHLAARQLAADFVRLEEAEAALAVLAARQEEMQVLSVQLENIRRAEAVSSPYGYLCEAANALRTLQRQLETECGMLPQHRETLVQKTARHAQMAAQAEKETSRLAGEEKSARDALAVFARLTPLRGSIAARRSEAAEAEKHCRALDRSLAKLERQLEKDRKEREGLLSAGAALENCRRHLSDTEKARKACRDLQRLEEKLQNAQEAYREAESRLSRARADFAVHEKAYYDDQAGVLAGQLEDGVPCPVCGSVSHPAPHRAAAHTAPIPTREDLDAEAAGIRALDEERHRKSTLSSRIRGEKEAAAVRAGAELAPLEALASRYAVPVSQDTMIFLAALRQALEAEDRELTARETRRNTLTAAMEEAGRRLPALKAEATAARENLETLRRKLSADEAEEKTLTASVPFACAEKAEESLNGIRRQLEMQKRQLAAAADGVRLQTEKVTAAETRIRDLRAKTIPAAEAHMASCRARYEKVLQESGLEEEAWQAFLDRDVLRHRPQMEEELAAYSRSLHSQQGRADTLREKVAGKQKPDTEKARILEEEAARKMQETQQAASALAAAGKENAGHLRELRNALSAYQGPAAENARLQQLSSRISGRTSHARVDLETYVQRLYMEEILEAANARFMDMTAGRFILRLRDTDLGQGRSNNGLDLMVYSNETQRERSIATLSGGESFLAALALALGLADTIEARSSAVQLDMMFIDEGFGSLDDTARRSAVRMLQKLTDGRKLIGIISHVAELRQEIDERLIVTKDENGSHARWEHA